MAFEEAREQVLSTLNRDGSRHWLYPRPSPGRFLTARRLVAWLLIAVFALLPHIQVNGRPFVLLDIPARRFTIFGFTFLPGDTLLLALFLVMVIVSIFLITALFGRVWCGWMCPQTVYMEFLYRPLERLFDGPPGPRGTPGSRRSPVRTVFKYLTFLGVSMFLAHTFLAYFVGVEALARWVRQSPWEHPTAFLVMAATTLAMLFNFGYFREQTCIVACPYGRLQSVLVDRNSLIVSYDARRGEPRGPVRRTSSAGASRGDCIDCGLCVATCPTGIDIRNGLQMECVACAQCIDACDAVMDRLRRPRGLIRYSSQARMAGEPGRVLRPRVVLYPLVLVVLGILFGFTLEGKTTVDLTVLRGLGNPFTLSADGQVTNQARLKLTNRTLESASYRIEIADDQAAKLIIAENPVRVGAGETHTESVLIVLPRSEFRNGYRDIRLRVSMDGLPLREVTYRLLGPEGPAGSERVRPSGPEGSDHG